MAEDRHSWMAAPRFGFGQIELCMKCLAVRGDKAGYDAMVAGAAKEFSAAAVRQIHYVGPIPDDGKGAVAERMARMDLTAELLLERDRQDKQWGGAAHDDTHSPDDWLQFIQQHARKGFVDLTRWTLDPARYRARLVKIAALALAALESYDRLAAKGERQG